MVSTDPGVRRRLITAGAQWYLVKPFDIAEFLRLVDDTLGGRA